MIEKKIFTKFVPKISTMAARKMDCKFIKFTWYDFIDKGAANALKNGKVISCGYKTISGKFDKGENILIADEDNKLVRGLASFSSSEIEKLKVDKAMK